MQNYLYSRSYMSIQHFDIMRPSETCFDSETLFDDSDLQVDNYSLICREHPPNVLRGRLFCLS